MFTFVSFIAAALLGKTNVMSTLLNDRYGEHPGRAGTVNAGHNHEGWHDSSMH